MHEALEELARVDARLVQVVEMRYFAGMTEPEIAAALGINERTVRRDWQKARLLLADAHEKDRGCPEFARQYVEWSHGQVP